jgi:hypothetical protein
MVSNTGNFKQDMLTNATNLFIVSNTKNPVVSSFMQGAATSFISSMFANNAEAQRQQLAMAQEILRRREEQEQQRRIAEQQRLDAMFARLNQALKLEGLPFGLSLKSMNTGADLQLKSMNSSGPDDLKLKMGGQHGYGIEGLPGIYVGGPAGTPPPDGSNGHGYGIQGLPGINIGGPAPGTAGDATIATTDVNLPGLPGIYLHGVQPSQAPALAQAAQSMNGPERALAEEAALQAAQKNPAMADAPKDSPVENFQRANQDYQQALQANADANNQYQTARGHVEADKSAIEIAQTQLRATTPTVEQTQAFQQMVNAAQTDEDAAATARTIFENADVHLTQARTQAASALANLAPAPAIPTGLAAPSSDGASAVDLRGTRAAQPSLLRQTANSAPFTGGRGPTAPPVSAVVSHPQLPVVADLAACLTSSSPSDPVRTGTRSPEELRGQLDAAKEALRRLIEDHEKEDALREQWDEEVNDAVHDAKKQAFDLSVDYLLHSAQVITRTKIFKADAEVAELQKLSAAAPSGVTAIQNQVEQASARAQSLQRALQSLKDLKNGIEEQERLRDLREWAQKDPEELKQASGYLEGVKQLLQAALAEDSVKAALHSTPYVNDAIKWGSSLIDTGYDLTAEYLSSRQLDQLNRNSEKYLLAVSRLNQQIQRTVTQLNCYKTTAWQGSIVAGTSERQ